MPRDMFPDEVRDALKATGLPYEIKTGKKHFKFFLSGRLVGVTALSGRSKNERENNCRHIKRIERAAKEIRDDHR